MKKIIVLILLAFIARGLQAQTTNSTHRILVYPQFKPASITLMNGKVVTVPLANIFLKRSSLIYHSLGGKNMEARLSNIKSVDFDDRHYERIDTMLAWRVDTVGRNALYCVSKIDIASLRNAMLNSRSMTNLELSSSMLNTTTLDVPLDDIEYPIINVYFYVYNGKTFPVHEREITRRIPKSKLYDYKIVTSLPTFSWTDPQSLIDLLRRISK
ncbi:MAG: hypothetical protein I3J02_01770 [Prevotella sp.]|nr:hypothetical protein [Prevotella sp.]